MRLYFAGAENLSMLKNLIQAGAKNVLMSYYYLQESGIKDIKHWLSSERINFNDLSIYLDCGAYTAWVQNKKINLQSYINFVKFNKNYLYAYSALDDKNSPEKTKENLKVMEEEGLQPVAVYHVTMKDWDYFQELCRTHDYVAIGAIAGEHEDYSVVERNLRKLVEIAKPFRTKLHVYGFTVYKFLSQVPVYSCDSTSWLDGGKRGTLMFANHSRHELEGLSYHDKALFRYKDKLSQMGFDYQEVIKDKNWKLRDMVNIKTFLEINEELNKIYEKQGLRYWDDEGVNIISQLSQNDSPKLSLNEPQNEDLGQNSPKSSDLGQNAVPNKVDEKPNDWDKYKGKIMELRQDEGFEAKRKEAQRQWAKTGLAHFKTGRYATFPFLFPDKDYALSSVGKENYDPKEYYKQIIESVQDLDVKNSDKLLEMLNDILRVDVIRAAKNLIYESADGGIQDKNLSVLLNNISNRMIAILELKQPQVNINNVILQTAESINNQFNEETKQQLIIALRNNLAKDDQTR